MRRDFVAKPYKYADNVPWNEDRYEVFVWNGTKREWVSVGGAIRTWSGRTIAFLCRKSVQRRIHTPAHAEELCDGNFIYGPTVKGALFNLKEFFSDPETILKEQHDREMAFF